ncbi:ABC1 kinase family protein [Natronogracilivirga saccharolytica]|uniref:AarF/ABC1/UbiB kinase family protein n=1 Tax=Natronogracilivirga saccharolytica TaxID=2812953 RepID=A0A8J7RP60_9BACT|nr:AarF/ABC1/UbiB kinase family protein [Natronogracilivirga saccharolytica]MBP3193354.1 AarF/ABC1/UbiB kinase family protein [Natronogracilivirga saccharolytica]
MSKFPSSRLERSARIARTGFRVGKNYAMHHFKHSLTRNGAAEEAKKKMHTANATYLYEEFSQLRGTALKLAQTLSLDHGILPDEFADIMAQAQYRVPPISKSVVRQVIKKELGEYPETLFASFEADASAAASIGQVHRARLHDGRDVMVKVQYPDIRASIGSDLSMAKMVFKRMVSSSRTDDYFAEVQERMMEETDYRHEGQQIAAFRERYHGNEFEIPEYVEEYSTAHVLTMTRVTGRHLGEFLEKNPGQEEKDRYGQLLWDFFNIQINDSRTLHADAHPGNFMLTGDGRLGVLDFGCVKVCPPDFFHDYVRLLPAHLENDEETLWPLYARLGLVREDSADREYEKYFFELCRSFGDLVVMPYTRDTFDFGDEAFSGKYKSLIKEATSQPEPRGTHHFIYVTRAHVGLYRMLMQLEANVRTRPARDRIMNWWAGRAEEA